MRPKGSSRILRPRRVGSRTVRASASAGRLRRAYRRPGRVRREHYDGEPRDGIGPVGPFTIRDSSGDEHRPESDGREDELLFYEGEAVARTPLGVDE